MGRYKKYVTNEDRQRAKKRWNHEYYIRNKQQVDAAAKKRYHKKLGEVVSDEGFCRKMGYEYKLVDVEPNSLLLKEKYLNGEIKFVDKYKSRFEKYIGVKTL